MLLAAFLLLYDSSHLTYTNEMFFIRSKNKWRYVNDSNFIQINGRSLYVSNPFFLHQEEYLLKWDFEKINFLEAKPLPQINRDMKWILTALAYVSLVLVFLVLPWLLFGFRTDVNLAVCAGLIYANALLIGSLVWAYQSQLGISKKHAHGLLLELILCPLFSINIIKKISALQSVNVNLISAAIRHLDSTQWHELCLILKEKINDELSHSDLDEEYTRQLSRSLHVFEGVIQNMQQ